MIQLWNVNKGKLTECILKASVKTVFCLTLSVNKITKIIYGPSITHRDDHFGKWARVVHLSFCFQEILYRTFHGCFLPNFGSFGYSFQRRYLEITCGVAAMFVNTSGINEQFYTEPTMDVSYQVLIHLTKRFQRRRFVRNRPFRNKNCLYRPCLLTDQDEINNLYRGPTTYASYQVSVHLA